MPWAATSPRSLMEVASVNVRPEPDGTRAFKSTMGPPSSHRKACRKVKQSDDPPTIWPFELRLKALLHGSPSWVPRSVISPFFQRNASCFSEPGKSALPTADPASLIAFNSPLSPPKVPKSVSAPWLQRNGWHFKFPTELGIQPN